MDGMAERFSAFSFVDRITTLEPGVRAAGSYAIPAHLPSFPASRGHQAQQPRLQRGTRAHDPAPSGAVVVGAPSLEDSCDRVDNKSVLRRYASRTAINDLGSSTGNRTPTRVSTNRDELAIKREKQRAAKAAATPAK